MKLVKALLVGICATLAAVAYSGPATAGAVFFQCTGGFVSATSNAAIVVNDGWSIDVNRATAEMSDGTIVDVPFTRVSRVQWSVGEVPAGAVQVTIRYGLSVLRADGSTEYWGDPRGILEHHFVLPPGCVETTVVTPTTVATTVPATVTTVATTVPATVGTTTSTTQATTTTTTGSSPTTEPATDPTVPTTEGGEVGGDGGTSPEPETTDPAGDPETAGLPPTGAGNRNVPLAATFLLLGGGIAITMARRPRHN